jgi:Bardet-Biedl syndrome 1 protein
MACQGQLDVDYRIYVACRDGKVYQIKNGAVEDKYFNIDCKPVGMALLEKTLVIAGMNNMVTSFYLKGKRNFAIQMPA